MRSAGSSAYAARPRHRPDPELPALLSAVEQQLRGLTAGCANLSAPLARLQAFPGKRVRALIVLGFALQQDCVGTREPALRAAAAIELIHEGSLVHDDIVDGSLMRRGQPSTAAEFGIRCAAHAGIHLVARGVETLVAGACGNAASADLGLLRRLACAQMLERMPAAGSADAQRRRVLEIIDGKTGALFQLAARTGARIGAPAPDSRPIELATAFACELARGYQIRDDVRDLTGDPRLGKPGGSDLANGVHSWPLLLWASERWPERAQRLEIARASAGLRDAIHSEILASDAPDRALQDAHRHFAQARAHQQRLGDSEGTALLGRVLDTLQDG